MRLERATADETRPAALETVRAIQQFRLSTFTEPTTCPRCQRRPVTEPIVEDGRVVVGTCDRCAPDERRDRAISTLHDKWTSILAERNRRRP